MIIPYRSTATSICSCGYTGCPKNCTYGHIYTNTYSCYDYRTYQYSDTELKYRELLKKKPFIIFIDKTPLIEHIPNYIFIPKHTRDAILVRRNMFSVQRVYSSKIKRLKKHI